VLSKKKAKHSNVEGVYLAYMGENPKRIEPNFLR